MKNFKSLKASVCLCLFIILCLTGCNKNNQFVGWWYHDWGHDGFDYICFKDNGVCWYNIGGSGDVRGSYKIDDKINEVVLLDSLDNVSITFKYADELLENEEYGYSLVKTTEEDIIPYFYMWGMKYAITHILPDKQFDDSSFDNEVSVEYDESDYYDEPDDNSRYDDNSYDSPFRHASDVMTYLTTNTFEGNATLTFRPDGMFANGKQLTGAIVITDFNNDEALFQCTSPYNGVTLYFHLYKGNKIVESRGETYYVR